MSECCGGGKTRLLYSCSGCSDVGEIADKTARKLTKEGFGKITCLAGVGAHLSGFVASAKGADETITIDGCPVACAKKNLEHIEVSPKSFILTEMGLVKGKTEVTNDVVDVVCRKISGSEGLSKSNSKNSGGSCCS